MKKFKKVFEFPELRDTFIFIYCKPGVYLLKEIGVDVELDKKYIFSLNPLSLDIPMINYKNSNL